MPAAFHPFLRVARRMLVPPMAVLASGCGGGGNAEVVQSAAAVAVQASAVARGSLLQSGWSAYPRLVRLSHQSEPTRNGVIVASVTEMIGGSGRAGFHVSRDDGASFGRIGTLVEDDFA